MDYRRLLKLLVLCFFFLAVVKLFFGGFTTNGQGQTESTSKRFEILNPGKFWSKKAAVQKDPQLLKEALPKPIIVIKTNPKTIVRSTTDAPMKRAINYLRVVHLDLKGAAPNIGYLRQIFPLISALGANGVLMEYEDMFPYEGDLKLLRAPFAYSVQDVEEIVNLAHINNLELIPLVQVFGHLEFVLKHEKYFNLREVADFPNSLNPLASGSLDLIKEMLTQVLRRHPNVQRFHIGADEVFGLGESESSKHWIQHNGSLGYLFLSHVTKVCHFMAEQRPGIKLMFWEDMLRKISSATMKESGMTSLASPMIWKYDSNMDISKIGVLISRYQEAGFKSVWFASAFKGASGIDQRWTPLNHHLQNHLAWLKVINSMTKYPSITLDGIVLTGWQRYEHHSVLCELFPVGTPSLAICLQTLKHGSFDETVKAGIQRMIGCTVDLTKSSCEGPRSFPGSRIYSMVQKIHKDLQKSVEKIMQNNAVRGSFSPYQRKYSFANPRSVGYFKNEVTKFLNEWETILETFQSEMDALFYADTVEEWIEENVNIYMNKVRSLAKDVEQTLKLKGQPKSLNPSYENKEV